MAGIDSSAVEARTCKKCGVNKRVAEFPVKRSDGKSYTAWSCKTCVNAEQKRRYTKTETQRDARELRERNAKLLPLGMRECKDCRQTLATECFRFKQAGYLLRCYGCQAALMRAKYAANEDGLRDYVRDHGKRRRAKHAAKLNEQKREYVAKNRAKVTQRQNEWAKKKLRDDPMFALKKRIRSLMSNAFASVGSQKNAETVAILGCSFDEFKEHLERQFVNGMSWERMGRDIHVDHIVPLATATCAEDVVALNHFTNLRPMWAKDNISKGAKIVALL